MDRVAEAAAAVASARRRLAAREAAGGAALGALGGAALGAALWIAARWGGFDAALWPLAAPAAGAAAGAVSALARGVRDDVAALSLDAAAATDEAFISAMTVTDAAPGVLELTADRALAKCPRGAVGRFIPFRAPGVATSAAVATALLAALVLVPRASDGAELSNWARGNPGEHVASAATGATSGGAAASPRARVDALRDEIAKGAEPPASDTANVRRDLAAVTDDDLRKLADALAAQPASSAAAKRALSALDRGDRAAAAEALREALGGTRSAGATTGTGTQTAAGPVSQGDRVPWASATWPLRYDRVVRRWLDESAALEGTQK
jgi:hypothetical protein